MQEMWGEKSSCNPKYFSGSANVCVSEDIDDPVNRLRDEAAVGAWQLCVCTQLFLNRNDRTVQRTAPAGTKRTSNHVDKHERTPEWKQTLMGFSHGMPYIFVFKNLNCTSYLKSD